MAKQPTSVIGVDLGRHSLKSVLLQRKGADRIVLTNYAVHVRGSDNDSPEELGRDLKALLKKMGGRAKACAVAISRSDSLIRIIEQPETPVEILRQALRLNGMALLNQEVREFAIDCDLIQGSGENGLPPANEGDTRQRKYLVGGLPRTRVAQIDAAFQKSTNGVDAIQLAPICLFNAFEYAHSEIFNKEAFLLIDIGHAASTLVVGLKRELILVRSIDYGGKMLVESVAGESPIEVDAPLRSLESGNETEVEKARVSLSVLTREISSSIGFFEGRHEETLRQIFVSGGAAQASILKVISEELQINCETWNPFQKVEIALPAKRQEILNRDAGSLAVACGAAVEFLQGK